MLALAPRAGILHAVQVVHHHHHHHQITKLSHSINAIKLYKLYSTVLLATQQLMPATRHILQGCVPFSYTVCATTTIQICPFRTFGARAAAGTPYTPWCAASAHKHNTIVLCCNTGSATVTAFYRRHRCHVQTFSMFAANLLDR
jgi:hypothetical protein